jgi:hypothetical protein
MDSNWAAVVAAEQASAESGGARKTSATTGEPIRSDFFAAERLKMLANVDSVRARGMELRGTCRRGEG